MKLTPQQQALVDYIEQYQKSKGTAPSQREIQKKFGFASRNAVPKHLTALEKKGVLQRAAGQARSLNVPQKMAPPFLRIPLLGSIVAGYAEKAEEVEERSLTVDAETLQLSPQTKTFALRIRGDSMVDAGIFDGDLVVLEQTVITKNGDIVAALLDGESTLKRLLIEEGKSFLKAENSRYPELIPLEGLEIQGVFRALIRISQKRL